MPFQQITRRIVFEAGIHDELHYPNEDNEAEIGERYPMHNDSIKRPPPSTAMSIYRWVKSSRRQQWAVRLYEHGIEPR